MSTTQVNFTYNVEDINNGIRKTNNLLRAINATRLSFVDMQGLLQKPTFAKFMWTVIQLSRTYTAWRRLYRAVIREVNAGGNVVGMALNILEPPMKELPTPSILPIQPLSVRVEAFRENLPMGLNGLDISNLPADTEALLQQILEEDAEETVADAREILVSRILHPEKSTGTLEASIGWMPEVFGTRIYANAFYAWWVEEGQRTFTGHHYLRGATDLARQRLPDKIREALNQLITEET